MCNALLGFTLVCSTIMFELFPISTSPNVSRYESDRINLLNFVQSAKKLR